MNEPLQAVFNITQLVFVFQHADCFTGDSS